MCGIAGVFHIDGALASQPIAAAMAAALRHRGPNSEGSWASGPVAVGHRRLSVIDLSPAASQPIQTPDGKHVLVYNGEIYNFVELRGQLERLGHRFRTLGDSEVVLLALAEWGVDALSRFNGMFALAYWNGTDKRLLLARDRYGIKPLYWTARGGQVLFASEVKAILAHPDVRATVDRSALVEYFTFQNILTDKTLFDGIKLLPAGSFLEAVVGGPVSAPRRYWDFDFHETAATASDAEYAEELDRLFLQAVRRQLVSDVPLGAYLSGGMDTGAITAHAAAAVPNMPSFTVGFDLRSASGIELGFDERERAEYMSYLFGTEHYEMVLKAGDMQRSLPAVVWHLEDPRVGQCYPNYFAAKLASRLVTVVLSGTGGDELFGGYPWRYYRAMGSESFEQFIDCYLAYWQRLVPPEVVGEFFRPLGSLAKDICVRDIFRSVFDRHASELTRPQDYVNHCLYFEAKTFLHGLLLVEDKLSMAHGLETRLPFLDNDLVDFAMRLPASKKLARFDLDVRLDENEVGSKPEKYFMQTSDGKLLLRKVMSRYVPSEVTGREKQGFSGPDGSWFRGESIEFVRRRLMDKNSPIYDYVDRETVRQLVTDHLEGRANRRLLIWSLLTFDQWLSTFMGAGA